MGKYIPFNYIFHFLQNVLYFFMTCSSIVMCTEVIILTYIDHVTSFYLAAALNYVYMCEYMYVEILQDRFDDGRWK